MAMLNSQMVIERTVCLRGLTVQYAVIIPLLSLYKRYKCLFIKP